MSYEDWEASAIEGPRLHLLPAPSLAIADEAVAVVEMDFTKCEGEALEQALREVHRVLKFSGRAIIHPPTLPSSHTDSWRVLHADSEYAVLSKRDGELGVSEAPYDSSRQRLSKEVVDYREAWIGEAREGRVCGNCIFYQEDQFGDEKSGCELVSGIIESDDTCTIFRADVHEVSKVTTTQTHEGDTVIYAKAEDWGGEEPQVYNLDLVKAVDENRYTFAVVYKATNQANSPEDDAHQEYASADDLRDATWNHVKQNDRSIFVQHGQDPRFGFKKAGEWVEIVTWPQEAVFDFTMADGTLSKRTIPANSVYMGVQWQPWAWKMVKRGVIRGLSFGGRAKRVGAETS